MRRKGGKKFLPKCLTDDRDCRNIMIRLWRDNVANAVNNKGIYLSAFSPEVKAVVTTAFS